MPDMLVLSEALDGPFTTAKLRAQWDAFDPSGLEKDDLLADRFFLAEQSKFRVYFAPLGEVPNATARIILVGLTPGLTQITIAAQLRLEFGQAVQANELAFANLIRSRVSYAGSMRKNAIAMLDGIGLNNHLSITSSEELFDVESQLCATTSALIYPVFTMPDLDNFSGKHTLGEQPLFRKMLSELLAPRLRSAPDALIIPFGKSAASGLDYIIQSGSLDARRVLRGFPHPSGQNGHRVPQFEANRLDLIEQVVRWFR